MATEPTPHGEELTRDDILWLQGHPLRWRIWVALCDGVVASPQDLATEIDARVENVAYHVRQLRDRGLLRAAGTEKRRGRTAQLYAVTDNWIQDDVWDELPPSAKRPILLRNLGWVARSLRASVDRGGFDHPRTHVVYHRLRLSPGQRDELAREVAELHERVRTLPHREAGDPPSSGGDLDVVVVLMQFEE